MVAAAAAVVMMVGSGILVPFERTTDGLDTTEEAWESVSVVISGLHSLG